MMHKTIKPSPLKKGDTIGLVAPAGPVIDEDRFAAGVRLLHELGFNTKFRRERCPCQGYLAAPDTERLLEFTELWADPEVRALMAVRGGYGCCRMVAGLDFELIRQQPKILIGFSDITVLLSSIHKKAGLVTFHGPVVTTLPLVDKYSLMVFTDALQGKLPERYRADGLEILRPGSCQGPLLVGNLTTLVHLVGTPFEPEWQGVILVLEDVGEPAYRLDRKLTQLAMAGRLDQVAGIILGSFSANLATGESPSQAVDEAVWQRVLELTVDVPIPVWGGFPVGHGRRNHLVPLGIKAAMDGGSGTLFLDEAAYSG